MDKNVVLAGATGNLGGRITSALLARGANVTTIIRRGVAPDKVAGLRQLGATIAEVDFASPAELSQACTGATCVVSALAGLREVIVDAQAALLEAAVKAGVPRFIPSDYSIDFTRLPVGQNRNLDLRREFHERLDRAPIAATSIFNGAFMDLLTGQAPFILFKWKRVLCWGDADQRLDFTTIEDTAAFTAAAALDESTPRALHVAGDRISARGLAAIAHEVTGRKFRVWRPGGLATLAALIKIARALFPSPQALYPPWQGMQYMHNMFSGLASVERLDNDRYPGMRWTTTREHLGKAIKPPTMVGSAP
jgi:nucleoside-diphosphate-sugar epimerase